MSRPEELELLAAELHVVIERSRQRGADWEPGAAVVAVGFNQYSKLISAVLSDKTVGA
jgi:hypothetical protein